MSTKDEYLASAKRCVELAGQVTDYRSKAALLDAAATWLRLAQLDHRALLAAKAAIAEALSTPATDED